MATIKSFISLEQSRKLAEILPIETADMCYIKHCTSDNPTWRFDGSPMILGKTPIKEMTVDVLPCWSLAALLNIIPQEIFDGEYIINITEGINNRWVITYDHHENRNHSYYGLSTGADNLVDACTYIIIKLKERNII